MQFIAGGYQQLKTMTFGPATSQLPQMFPAATRAVKTASRLGTTAKKNFIVLRCTRFKGSG